MSNREIVVENLVKRYPKDVVAVDDISFEVRGGSIFGFLGPNGAGKSTTIRILTTLALPTAGRASIGGYDVVKEAQSVRHIAGVALQEIGLDPIMKAMEMLIIQGRLFGMSQRQASERGRELLDLVGLTDAMERRVGTYSGGMRRRLDLAVALVHEPEILFLDEPTTGLDPASRRDVWGEIRRLNEEMGITIFLTTQYLEEADQLAETVAIIDEGKIVVQGTPAKLKASVGTESINVAFDHRDMAAKAAGVLRNVTDQIQSDRDTVRLYIGDAAEAVPAVMDRLRQSDLEPMSLTITQPTLDDVFLQYTGQRLASRDQNGRFAEAETEKMEV